MGGRASAPLGGLILLEQGRENAISRLSAREAVFPVLRQFVADLDTEEEIRAMCGIAESVLRSVPVWKLVNLGDDASTALLRNTLCSRRKKT